MNDSSTPCEFLVDVYGLRDICLLPVEKKTAIIGYLKNGRIRLLTRVWQEFEEIFPDLTVNYQHIELYKITMKPGYHVCAATLAEQTNSGFADRAYDGYSDWFTASACQVEGYAVITSDENRAFYERLAACPIQIAGDLR